MLKVARLLVPVLLVFATISARAQTPLTTTFTYQGELASGGTPATGTYDLRFRLYDAVTGGKQIGSTLCLDNQAITNGRFTTSLDFGAAFAGQKRFLEIEVRQDTGLNCSASTGYTTLAPRQELTATPNAIFAQSAATATTALTASNAASLSGQSPSFYQNAANLTGTLADARLSSNVARLNANQTFTGQLNFTNAGNTFAGNGAGLTNINGGSINAGTLTRSSLNADVQSGLGTLLPDLSLAGSAATGIQPNSVAVSGSFAYVVNLPSNTLQVFNISNPATPALLGSVATGDFPSSVAVSGSFAYVVNGNSSTLQVFNISNPAAPTLAGSVATGSFPNSVAVSGSFAYVVNWDSNTLQVFNISNPATPTLVGSVATGNLPNSVAVSGSFAYVVNGDSSTLQVFNISNPAAPTLAGSVVTAIQPSSVAVSGSFAYVVSSISNTLQVFNISNPAAPTLAGSVVTGSVPVSVAVSGLFAYVVNFSSNTLQVFRSFSLGFGATLSASNLTGVNGSGLANLDASKITTGTLANARTTGTNLNTPSTLVLRDAFGNFAAATITAALNGNATTATTATTATNATQLNGQPASFYTNASNITTGTLPAAQVPNLDASKITTGTLSAAVLPVSAWVTQSLPAGSISSSVFTEVSGTSRIISMRQGVAVVSWSVSGYSSVAGTDINLRIRAVTNGTSTFGPATIFTFNQASVHTTISGNAVITIPATANTTFSLEVARTSGTGIFNTDSRDSFTASIINIGQ